MSQVEYLRSEAQLQGKTYKLELDLTNQRYRMILPPEEKLVSEQSAAEAIPLGWTDLDDRVRFVDHSIVGGPSQKDGKTFLVIDPHGFTADQNLILGMKSEALSNMVWTIRIHGLIRRADLVLSLSALTFTHEMSRLVLLEQIYRALTILRGGKYHK